MLTEESLTHIYKHQNVNFYFTPCEVLIAAVGLYTFSQNSRKHGNFKCKGRL